MRQTLLIDENTEAQIGLRQEREDVFMHPTGGISAELSAGEWVGAEES